MKLIPLYLFKNRVRRTIDVETDIVGLQSYLPAQDNFFRSAFGIEEVHFHRGVYKILNLRP